MKVELRKSFTKDADKLPAAMQRQLAVIIGHIQNVRQVQEIRDCKKLKGHKMAYRIRLGSYRIAFYYENGIVELVRVLNRKDIYRYFP